MADGAEMVIKIRLRGFDAEDLSAWLMSIDPAASVETQPRRPWQIRPTVVVTMPWQGREAYMRLRSRLVVRVGAMSNTAVKMWAEPSDG